MIEDAPDLAIQHAHIRATLGHRNAGKPLDGQAEGVLLIHRRDIVEPVEIADALQIGLVFQQLFGAAMKQTDMRVYTLDDLAIQLQHHAQNAVRCRVDGAKIDREIADVLLSH